MFLPVKFHGQRSLADYSSWGRRDSDITEQLKTTTTVPSSFHIQSFLSPFLLLLSTLILICWHSLNTAHCDVLCLFVFVETLMFLDVPPVVAYFIIFSVAFITLFLFLSLLLECELLQHLDDSEA